MAPVLAASLALACGGRTSSTSASPVAPSASTAKCGVSAGLSTSTFPHQGGAGAVQVATERECAWTAGTSVSWIHLSSTNGSGGATISFQVDSNPAFSAREGAIDVAGSTLTVAQQAAPPPPPPPPPPAPTPAPPAPPSPPPAPAPPSPPAPTPNPPPDNGDDDDDDDDDQEVRLAGSVSSLGGSCPSLTFVVQNRTVRTSASTEFRGIQCKDIRNSVKVKVRGRRQADNSVLATRVERD